VQIDAHTWDEYELLDDVEKFCEHFKNTADVAPRAEIANKICCEIEEEIVAALESNYRALKEWDDGRCNDYILEMVNRIKGKIDALRGIEAFVEELKNKYAEGRNER
jgi:hypothetical protein